MKKIKINIKIKYKNNKNNYKLVIIGYGGECGFTFRKRKNKYEMY